MPKTRKIHSMVVMVSSDLDYSARDMRKDVRDALKLDDITVRCVMAMPKHVGEFPLQFVGVNDDCGTILIRRFDTLGMIVPVFARKVGVRYAAHRRQQHLGLWPTLNKAAEAVERADKLAMPGEPLTPSQLAIVTATAAVN
jgi:hypothetical protein